MLSWLLRGWFFAEDHEEGRGEKQVLEINYLRDALELLKPLVDGKLFTRKTGDGVTGFVAFDLSELAFDVEYQTERGSRLKRISDGLIQMSCFTLPVYPNSSECLLECEVLPSTAKALLELHAKRKLGSSRDGHPDGGGVLLFDEKRLARFVTQLDQDLHFGVQYSSANNEITLERHEHNGRVHVKINQAPGSLHHFVNGGSSPAMRSPATTDSGEVDELTPMPYKNSKPHSLRNRLHNVRGGMTKIREIERVTMSALASPESSASSAAEPEAKSSASSASCLPENAFEEGMAVGSMSAPPPPPPPPPPPLSTSFATPKKPQKRMTKLHWRPALNRGQSFLSVMGTCSPEKNEDDARLEQLFSAPSPVHRNRNKADKTSSSAPSDGSCRLIAFKTNQKCGIVLARFRNFSVPELKRKVLSGELDLDQLKSLLSLFPLSQQEHSLLMQFKGDLLTLQPVERFYVEFLAIPRVEQRLNVLIFSKSFPSQMNDIGRGLAIICEACDEIRASNRLKTILKKVTKIGKKLTGDANFSFSVSSLLKMGDTKARDKSTSLLEFFVSVSDAETLAFDADLPSLAHVCRLSLTAIEDEVRSVGFGLTTLRDEISRCSASDAFAQLFKENDMSLAVEDARDRLAECQQIFAETVVFFGEDSKEYDVFQFFSIFASFRSLVIQTQKMMVTKAEAEKKKKKNSTSKQQQSKVDAKDENKVNV